MFNKSDAWSKYPNNIDDTGNSNDSSNSNFISNSI